MRGDTFRHSDSDTDSYDNKKNNFIFISKDDEEDDEEEAPAVVAVPKAGIKALPAATHTPAAAHIPAAKKPVAKGAHAHPAVKAATVAEADEEEEDDEMFDDNAPPELVLCSLQLAQNRIEKKSAVMLLF